MVNMLRKLPIFILLLALCPVAFAQSIIPPANTTVVQPTGTNLHAVIDSSALPTGAATQTTMQAILTLLTGGIPVTGTFWQTTQPVSISSLPLPTGAATQTTSAAILAQLVAGIPVTGTFWQSTQPVSAASLPLPTGASTLTAQNTGNASLATLGATVGTPGSAAPSTGMLTMGSDGTNAHVPLMDANGNQGVTVFNTPAVNVDAGILIPQTLYQLTGTGSIPVTLTPGLTYSGCVQIPATAGQTAFTSVTLTAGSPTGTLASTTGMAVGQQISGTDIPLGAHVTAISANASFTMDAPATGSATTTIWTTTGSFSVPTEYSINGGSTWLPLTVYGNGLQGNASDSAAETSITTDQQVLFVAPPNPNQATTPEQVRFRVATLTTLTAINLWIDNYNLGATIHLPFWTPTSNTFNAFSACTPQISTSNLSYESIGCNGFGGGTIQWDTSNDPLGQIWAAVNALVNPSTVATSAGNGAIQATIYAPFAYMLWGSNANTFNGGAFSLTAVVGPKFEPPIIATHAVTQSGTFTVQPGNTPNTTAWLVNAGLNPSTTALNTYENLLTTNATTTVTASTCYVSSLTLTIDTSGTTSTITVEDGQGTPQILINGLTTTTASLSPTVMNFQTPIKFTSGLKIITAGVAAATVSIWANYYQ